ncbi:MAG: class I SAM-dependent methyltransferase [Desulfopila sp.]
MRSINLKDYLQGLLSPEELALLVRSYDVVGDMAVIIIPPELTPRQRLIGEALMTVVPHIKVVAKRDGVYEGEFRTIALEVIAGESRKETLHKEYGVKLLVNPEAVYFSVRSATERKRIADQVRPGEEVLVLFSGIAPYPLIIAANSRAGRVVGIEKNPVAHQYALKNIKINRKMKNIELHCGDVAAVLPRLNRTFDRVVMPLPKGGEPFLTLALHALRPAGVLHYYAMLPQTEFAAGPETVRRAALLEGRTVRRAEVVRCGHCGPRTYRVCVDCLVD